MLGLSQGLDPDAAAYDASDAIAEYYRSQGYADASATFRVGAVRTVDSHLARTHHKLGITSRRELAGALGARLPAQPKKAS